MPDFCRDDKAPDYDRIMEPIVRGKMRQYKIAERSTGYGQPETAIMLTPIGAQIYRAGGWKKFIRTELLVKKEAADQAFATREAELRRERREMDKTVLEIEKLRYEVANRALDEEVKRLTALNLKLTNADTVGKWIIAAFASLATLLSSVFLEISVKLISKLARSVIALLS